MKILFVFLFLLFFGAAFGNPVPLPPEYIAFQTFVYITVIIFAFFFTVLSEFIVIYLLLKKFKVSWKNALLSSLIINSITYFPTQIIAFITNSLIEHRSMISSYWPYMFAPLTYVMPLFGIYSLAEILPFVSEYFLLKWRFNKLNKKELIKLTVIANTVTFVIGTPLFTFLMYTIR